MTKTRNKLSKYIHLLLQNADTNEIASAVGTIGETLICNYFMWENIDADGYDAVDHGSKKYEIKPMSYETKTDHVAYTHSKKKGRYDYLVVLHFDEERLAIIPHKEIDDYVNNVRKQLRLNFSDEIKTKLGKERKKSRFKSLFLKYEVNGFKF